MGKQRTTRRFVKTIYLRVPVRIEADTEAGLNECIQDILENDSPHVEAGGFGEHGGYLYASGKPSLIVQRKETKR